jgi:hypothetical protein
MCHVCVTGGMELRYNFEDQFSEDIWSKLAKRVASNMSRSVVALASFSGNHTHYKPITFIILLFFIFHH